MHRRTHYSAGQVALGYLGADRGQGVAEAGHDAFRRIRQCAVEIEDHQLWSGAGGRGRHSTIVADPHRQLRPGFAHYCSPGGG